MMRTKNSTEEWLSIQKSEIWEIPQENDRIMSVLELSFHNLKSSILKQCFAYCSMFKDDFEIERDKLIQLWMAQGFVHPSPGQSKQQMEDIGIEYFNILCQNSLLQDVTKDDDGIITKCKMHDLVHDLAKEVSKCESLMQKKNPNHEMEDHETPEIGHVSQVSSSTLESMARSSIAGLRSLFLNDQIPNAVFPKLRALRVLDFEDAAIEGLPNSIGKLKHLRYLNVSNTKIKELPKSIGRLYNLQTLRLQSTDLKKIPQEMQNLINLRHLYFDQEVEVPGGSLRQLTNLRTLPCFNVGKEMGTGIGELGGLNQLEGQLIIRNLENVRDEEEAKNALLVQKNLCKLKFEWNDSGPSNCNSEKVLDGLQPKPNLKSLQIEGFIGAKLSSWMMSLQNLKEIGLVRCSNCEGIPTLGHLPNLRHLQIAGMSNLKSLGAEFYVYNDDAVGRTSEQTGMIFPALKTLDIRSCSELIEWMEAPMMSNGGKVLVFPCLEELSLRDCPELRNAPSHFPCLKKLEISGMGNKMPIENIVSTPELTTLTDVRISHVKGLAYLPEGMLKKTKNLVSLEINGCDDLTCIAPNVFSCCTSLRKLRVWRCCELTSISMSSHQESEEEEEEIFPSLRELEILDCGKLKYLPTWLHCLTGLKELRIGMLWEELDSFPDFQLPPNSQLELLQLFGWPKLKCLPQILQHLTCLRQLEIHNFGGLEALPEWLGNLESLQDLSILNCENLKYLPSVEAMQRLTNVKELCISGCPFLKERCISNGPEWPKISDISHVKMDDD